VTSAFPPLQWIASADGSTWVSAVLWVATIVAVIEGAAWVARRIQRREQEQHRD
jgi:cytochrome c-type biogenesis protein CcmH/NrfF